MNKHFNLYFLALFATLMLCLAWGKAEEVRYPYDLSEKPYEKIAAFTNQFSGVTNETLRKSILDGFSGLPFARTGIVERAQSGTAVTLTIPLKDEFHWETTKRPPFQVKVRFQEPTGVFLPSPDAPSVAEAAMTFRCRKELHQYFEWNTYAATTYFWMAPIQDYGGLARIPFYALPKGSDESSPAGTNGWGVAFWVDLDTCTILTMEPFYPPEMDEE